MKGMTKPAKRSELFGDTSRVYIPGVNALGPLEKAIMDYIWLVGEATVPQIHKYMREHRKDLAYNTIMMTTTRLAEKGLLNQNRSARTFLYTPVVTKKQYSEGLVGRIMDRLVDMDSEAVIRHLAVKTAA